MADYSEFEKHLVRHLDKIIIGVGIMIIMYCSIMILVLRG